jgi:hypothetical protein
LIYIKNKNEKLKTVSSTLREKEGALNELVESVRIIAVKQENDALTIDINLLSNTDFFMKIMKLVDEEFLVREYKISKETSISGSLLFTKEDNELISKGTKTYYHV